MLSAPAPEAMMLPWMGHRGLPPAAAHPPPAQLGTGGVGWGLGCCVPPAWSWVGGVGGGVGTRGSCCNKGMWRACTESMIWGQKGWHGREGVGSQLPWGSLVLVLDLGSPDSINVISAAQF